MMNSQHGKDLDILFYLRIAVIKSSPVINCQLNNDYLCKTPIYLVTSIKSYKMINKLDILFN